MTNPKFEKPRGVIVPLVTPFTPQEAIDEAALARIVEHVLAAGVGGVFALGTTGESASIHPVEKLRLVQALARVVDGRAVVYAGISGNCLRESIEAAAAYHQAGADVAVAHVPYYYPVPEGNIVAYYRRLADSIPVPLMLYNIPGTTHVSFSAAAVETLSGHPNICGLKNSTRDEEHLTEVLRRVGGRPDFSVLVGSGPLYGKGLHMGADGIVPAAGNINPAACQRMVEAAARADWETLEQMQETINALVAQIYGGRTLGEALAVMKSMMAGMGLCSPAMLPPLGR